MVAGGRVGRSGARELRSLFGGREFDPGGVVGLSGLPSGHPGVVQPGGGGNQGDLDGLDLGCLGGRGVLGLLHLPYAGQGRRGGRRTGRLRPK